jgi:hypothetical protein
VGLIAREIESRGIPTVCLSSAWSIMASVRPPRSVFLDYPLGHTAGPRDDADTQIRILRDAVAALADELPPGSIRALPYPWPGGDDWKATAMQPTTGGRHRDDRTERSDEPQYQFPDDREAAGKAS